MCVYLFRASEFTKTPRPLPNRHGKTLPIGLKLLLLRPILNKDYDIYEFFVP